MPIENTRAKCQLKISVLKTTPGKCTLEMPMQNACVNDP